VSTPYSASFVPPAAVLEIHLAAPGGAQAPAPLTALIDTGADTSLAPQSVLVALGAPSLFEAQLRAPWGELPAVVIYLTDVVIGSERFPGIEFAADESESEVILGRNLLNKLALFLDGP
jgi:predicted aspartyl protease